MQRPKRKPARQHPIDCRQAKRAQSLLGAERKTEVFPGTCDILGGEPLPEMAEHVACGGGRHG
jgi:hypothetical protein